MAGMRVGYAIAHPKTLAAIRAHHSASGLSVVSLAAATASLVDTAHIERQAALNRAVRKSVLDGFTAAGYEIAASDANFVFVNIRRDSRGFQDAVLAKGVAIGRAFPPLNQWARITIGTAEEMARAMPILMAVLAAPPHPASAMLDRGLAAHHDVC
jgi:histidinol-phosphate aminotransferase